MCINLLTIANEEAIGKTNVGMNKFIDFYIDNVIKTFHSYNNASFDVSIKGLGSFAKLQDDTFAYLLQQLASCDFTVNLVSDDADDCFCILTIKGKNQETCEECNFCYNVQELLYLIDLSSKTNISLLCVIVMKIIAMFICRMRTLYKAIVLDLDNTLWNGTLSEVGVDKIIASQRTTAGLHYVRFAKFIKTLADNVGIYVAICSRNDSLMVSRAIDSLDEKSFPLKNSIDCIVANDNDKSSNIKEIATSLSILPKAIVFVDDNELIRDEVRNNISGICVPNWNSHEELMTLLSVGCVFDRCELSLNAQNRRKQYKMIQVLRRNNHLPMLKVKVIKDTEHTVASKLYKKTNQFNMSQQNGNFSKDVSSVYFEMYRQNEESLGICSALSYVTEKDKIVVENWAISCRFFEIGLEELILIYLLENAYGKRIVFKYCKNDYNGKATAMVKDNEEFQCVAGNPYVEYEYTQSTNESLRIRTNLKLQYDEK
jgi:FkbH-like protein